ncbi:MAG: acetylxylan esterase [Verrucomicrobiota bacterium]
MQPSTIHPSPLRKLVVILFLMTLPCHSPLPAADDLRVLPTDFNSDKKQQMMRSYLRQLTHQRLDQRLEEIEQLKSQEQIEAYQKKLQAFFLQNIGGLPPQSPLNAQVTGQHDYPDYSVENIIFESQPGFFVTANLYLPKNKGPHPGILLPCGHSSNGKAAEPYQKASILLAQNGFVVLCWDPIGQGERLQLLNLPNAPQGTSEHMSEGVAPILLGRGLSTYMIWDGMRAIDYLQSRPEVIPDKIGSTGISGGGNLTAMLMALDPRIKAAAPGCFITTTRIKNEKPGPGDAEQNIFSQTAAGLDHPDFAIIRAPQPTLILAATQDFVPIEGSWIAYRQAKRIYGRLGFPERMRLVEADVKHGFDRPLREATTRFMMRYLLNTPSEISEANEVPIAPDADLYATPEGQVLKLPNARSIFQVNQDFSHQLRKKREQFQNTNTSKNMLEKVRQLSNIRQLDKIPLLKKQSLGQIQLDGFSGEKILFTPEPGIVLPAIKFQPIKSTGEPILYLNQQGKTADPQTLVALLKKGHPILAVDIRDTGETRTHNWRYGQAAEITGPATAEFFIAYMLGKSYLGMRAEDILNCARYLSEENGAPQKIKLIVAGTSGELSPPALHAAALEPQLFSSTEFENSLETWQKVIDTPVTKNRLINTVHGALEFYDLPDLNSLINKNSPE